MWSSAAPSESHGPCTWIRQRTRCHRTALWHPREGNELLNNVKSRLLAGNSVIEACIIQLVQVKCAKKIRQAFRHPVSAIVSIDTLPAALLLTVVLRLALPRGISILRFPSIRSVDQTAFDIPTTSDYVTTLLLPQVSGICAGRPLVWDTADLRDGSDGISGRCFASRIQPAYLQHTSLSHAITRRMSWFCCLACRLRWRPTARRNRRQRPAHDERGANERLLGIIRAQQSARRSTC